jgi:hypothetical protein
MTTAILSRCPCSGLLVNPRYPVRWYDIGYEPSEYANVLLDESVRILSMDPSQIHN